ncbi:SgcJ/EcaC family oxidoreductase [Streptomyces sp. NPDC029216]|uniref:SgcJ/EcaC family oxidoreductase n=1 Tax=Streptomyces sp. NPDC029216 TaxID=3154701 RepID=UPI0033C1E380
MPADDNDDQIRDLYTRLMQAWTANHADAYGACFTEDCDYVSYDGTRAIGRTPMVDNHDRLFRGVLAGSALVGACESIRYVTSEVAIVHGTASVLMPWRAKLPKRRLSRQTLVAVRTGGTWRFTALHNGRVRPIGIPAPDSLPARLSQATSRTARSLGLGARPAQP